MAIGNETESAIAILQRSTNTATLNLVERQAPTAFVGEFSDIAGQEIAAAFAESLAPASVLDACLRYAKTLPPKLSRVLVATGFTGKATAEAAPRVIQNAGISVADCLEHQVSASLVFSQEVLRRGGTAVLDLFDAELRAAIARAQNAEMLAELDSSSATTVATTGDPAKDLRAALAKSDSTTGYVYVADGATIATIATDAANRGAGVRGGEFVPGVFLVADDTVTEPTLIPAGRLVLRDEGLRLEPPAKHASVNMSETPTSPSQQVSLWQTGCVGLIAFRDWTMNTDRVAIVKVTG